MFISKWSQVRIPWNRSCSSRTSTRISCVTRTVLLFKNRRCLHHISRSTHQIFRMLRSNPFIIQISTSHKRWKNNKISSRNSRWVRLLKDYHVSFQQSIENKDWTKFLLSNQATKVYIQIRTTSNKRSER